MFGGAAVYRVLRSIQIHIHIHIGCFCFSVHMFCDVFKYPIQVIEIIIKFLMTFSKRNRVIYVDRVVWQPPNNYVSESL